MITQSTRVADDVTEVVLDTMLNEALDLTDEIAAAGSVRRAIGAPDSFDCAFRLRLAARLSRIAAWASLRVSTDPERLAIAEAALKGAAEAINEIGDEINEEMTRSELAPYAGMVDRIVERALRLDALLSGEPSPSPMAIEAPHNTEGSAVILPFVRPVAQGDQDDAESCSEAP